MYTEQEGETMNHIALGRLRAFEVVGPEHTEHHASLWDYEPPETGCDYRLVFARTAQKAKVLAIRSWRKSPRSYIEPGENPFTGVRVFRADSRCFLIWE